MYEDELAVLNVRLRQYGYQSCIMLIRDFKDGRCPVIFELYILGSPEVQAQLTAIQNSLR